MIRASTRADIKSSSPALKGERPSQRCTGLFLLVSLNLWELVRSLTLPQLHARAGPAATGLLPWGSFQAYRTSIV